MISLGVRGDKDRHKQYYLVLCAHTPFLDQQIMLHVLYRDSKDHNNSRNPKTLNGSNSYRVEVP